MARKPSGRSHTEEVQIELNLAPIMAVIIILIPLLLYAFTFIEIKVQAISAPRMGSAKAKKEDEEKKPLNLTVLITSKGFVVKQQAELTVEPEKPIFKRVMADVDGVEKEDWDYPALYSRLMAKKKQYPEETTINIGAEMDIPWGVIARTIDTARVQLEQESYEKLAEYQRAPAKKQSDNVSAVEMFPAVVFVVVE
jgi:biopolymer transport protein ExbD